MLLTCKSATSTLALNLWLLGKLSTEPTSKGRDGHIVVIFMFIFNHGFFKKELLVAARDNVTTDQVQSKHVRLTKRCRRSWLRWWWSSGKRTNETKQKKRKKRKLISSSPWIRTHVQTLYVFLDFDTCMIQYTFYVNQNRSIPPTCTLGMLDTNLPSNKVNLSACLSISFVTSHGNLSVGNDLVPLMYKVKCHFRNQN